MNALRTPEINASLERTLTRERLDKYLATSGGDLDAALALYERNTRLSEALYGPFQALEVCLRNCVSLEMQAIYGNDWLVNGAPPLARFAVDAVAGARSRFAAPSIDDLTAELKFAFWVSLLGPGYDATLWRSALHKAFRASGARKRSRVHSRLNALRRFRNRVAHHEPVFGTASQMHAECLEAIGWMCADTCAWATFHSRFPAVYAGP